MYVPKIERSTRSREFNNVTSADVARVVVSYLFDGLSHRALDAKILGLDESYSRGYQAMGILHYLGLRNPFKGLFSDFSKEEAIMILQSKNDSSYRTLIQILQSTL